MINFRQKASFLRASPNYMIIGAHKSGTTSLFNYLSAHPQVRNSDIKELHYFDKNFDQPLSWYLQFFPLKMSLRKGCAVGEASPSYLFHPHVPARIHKLFPDMRMIAVLRNPVERVISQYFQTVRKNNITTPLIDLLHAEEEEEKKAMAEISQNPLAVPQNRYVLLKSRSRYAEQLKRYFSLFSREQILILSSKELQMRPNEALKKAYKFLNIDAEFYLREVSMWNVGTNKHDISPEIHEYLENYFTPHNQDLFDLLGYKIDW